MAAVELCHKAAATASYARVGRFAVPRLPVPLRLTPSRHAFEPLFLHSVSYSRASAAVCSAASAALDSSFTIPYEQYSDAASTSEAYMPGQVLTVHSRAQFEELLSRHKHQLIVLMCKSSHCRPCKMFGRKYSRLAEKLVDTVFLDIIGDETNDTRRMMMDMQVKATPTFRLYRGQQFVTALTGSNEKKLADALMDNLLPTEAGYTEKSEGDSSNDPSAPTAAEAS